MPRTNDDEWFWASCIWGFNFSKLRSGDVRLLEVVPWEVVRH